MRDVDRAVARAKSDAWARARDQPSGSAIRRIALGPSPSQEQVRGPLKGFWRRSRMSTLELARSPKKISSGLTCFKGPKCVQLLAPPQYVAQALSQVPALYQTSESTLPESSDLP